jgi:hypothetical protein
MTSGENFGDFLMMAPFSIEGASSKSGAVHLLDDDEPFDALLKTACGEAPLPEGPALTVFRLMMAKPAGDD